MNIGMLLKPAYNGFWGFRPTERSILSPVKKGAKTAFLNAVSCRQHEPAVGRVPGGGGRLGMPEECSEPLCKRVWQVSSSTHQRPGTRCKISPIHAILGYRPLAMLCTVLAPPRVLSQARPRPGARARTYGTYWCPCLLVLDCWQHFELVL